MKKKENYAKLLKFNPKNENNVFLENEIFDRLHDLDLKWKRAGYAFAHYYFHLWAYRYAKYQLVDGSYLANPFINTMIGFAPKAPPMSDIIKKGGILEQANLLHTVTDFPVSWDYTDDKGLSLMMLEDIVEGDHKIKKQMGIPHKYTVKRPVSGFKREKGDGVYFDISNTLHVEFKTFLYCLENEEIGINGFYMYCFLAHLNFKEGGKMVYKSPEGFSKLINGSPKTIQNTLLAMRDYNMVSCHVKDYVKIDEDSDEKGNPNGYLANEFKEFHHRKTDKPKRASYINPSWKGEKKKEGQWG